MSKNAWAVATQRALEESLKDLETRWAWRRGYEGRLGIMKKKKK